jgi:hypothetical protein
MVLNQKLNQNKLAIKPGTPVVPDGWGGASRAPTPPPSCQQLYAEWARKLHTGPIRKEAQLSQAMV